MTNSKGNTNMDIYDLYMEGFDEGKNDDMEVVVDHHKNTKKHSAKEDVSKKRKIAYYKSRNRVQQLVKVVHFVPDEDEKDVVAGMLRSHQLPIGPVIHIGGLSHGNMRRRDSAENKILIQDDEEDLVTI